MPGIIFGKNWRDRRDKIILDQHAIREVHKYKRKVADLVTDANPVTQKILRRSVERDRFGELLIEKGGGNNRSRHKDWGVTGVTDLGDIAETMAHEHLISPKEARAMAAELTKATGSRKRELINRLSNKNLFRKVSDPNTGKKAPRQSPFTAVAIPKNGSHSDMPSPVSRTHTPGEFLGSVRAPQGTHETMIRSNGGIHGFQAHGTAPAPRPAGQAYPNLETGSLGGFSAPTRSRRGASPVASGPNIRPSRPLPGNSSPSSTPSAPRLSGLR